MSLIVVTMTDCLVAILSLIRVMMPKGMSSMCIRCVKHIVLNDSCSHSSIEYTGKGKNKATRSIPPVTFSDHKFKHPGTTHARQGKQKKRDDRTPSPAPVEDSPPVTPSPRKRYVLISTYSMH